MRAHSRVRRVFGGKQSSALSRTAVVQSINQIVIVHSARVNPPLGRNNTTQQTNKTKQTKATLYTYLPAHQTPNNKNNKSFLRVHSTACLLHSHLDSARPQVARHLQRTSLRSTRRPPPGRHGTPGVRPVVYLPSVRGTPNGPVLLRECVRSPSEGLFIGRGWSAPGHAMLQAWGLLQQYG